MNKWLNYLDRLVDTYNNHCYNRHIAIQKAAQMHQRIDQLIEECTEYWTDKGDTYFDKEKFARLIVQQCMSMCDEQRAHYFGHRMASDDFIDKNMYAEGEAACDILQYKMKKHFGVEE